MQIELTGCLTHQKVWYMNWIYKLHARVCNNYTINKTALQWYMIRSVSQNVKVVTLCVAHAAICFGDTNKLTIRYQKDRSSRQRLNQKSCCRCRGRSMTPLSGRKTRITYTEQARVSNQENQRARVNKWVLSMILRISQTCSLNYRLFWLYLKLRKILPTDYSLKNQNHCIDASLIFSRQLR